MLDPQIGPLRNNNNFFFSIGMTLISDFSQGPPCGSPDPPTPSPKSLPEQDDDDDDDNACMKNVDL